MKFEIYAQSDNFKKTVSFLTIIFSATMHIV